MKNMLLVSAILMAIPAMAWEGYDYETGSYIEIEAGNLVREGQDIEIYDYSEGTYNNVEVESINDYGYSTEVEVYDYETGEYRTLEMDP